jgi:hypothetical protein
MTRAETTRVPARGLLVLALVSGCGTPRERDCKTIAPLLDDVQRARTTTLDDVTRPPAERAPERLRRTADSLRSVSLLDPELRDPVLALAGASDRLVLAGEAVAEVTAALRLRPGSEPLPDLRLLTEVTPNVRNLLEHCGAILGTPEQRAKESCLALERALVTCLSPPAEDTTVVAQVEICAAALEAARPAEAGPRADLEALVAALRRLVPLAQRIGAPARVVIRVAKDSGPSLENHVQARADVEAAEKNVRAMCVRR